MRISFALKTNNPYQQFINCESSITNLSIMLNESQAEVQFMQFNIMAFMCCNFEVLSSFDVDVICCIG